MKSLFTTTILLLNATALGTIPTAIPADCVEDYAKISQLGDSETSEPKTESEFTFAIKANLRARAEFQTLMGDDRKDALSFYQSGLTAAYVWVCDDDTGFEQGNCVHFYFKKSGSEARLIAAIEAWHIGEGLAHFYCEK